MSKCVPALSKRPIIENQGILDVAAEDIHKYGFFAYPDVSNGPRDNYPTAPVRRMDCWCLSHIHSGRCRGYIAGHGYFRISSGNVVLIAPGIDNITANDNSPDYGEDFLLFGGGIFDQMKAEGLISTGYFWLGTQRRLTLIAELLRDVTASSRWRASIELQGLLLELVRQKPQSKNNPVNALMEAIKTTPKHWWTLDEMANYCHLSRDQTRRLLKQQTGMTPKPYVEGVKLRRAAEELLGTNRRITEIAMEYGYRDPFHFSRRFNALFGVTPSRYREQLSPKSQT